MPGKLDVAADGVAVELRKKRVAELSNPNSEYFKASDAFLAQFVARAREEKRRKVERVEVPYKLMGEEIRKLEALFGVRVDVVPRRPTRTPMASATAWLAERRLEYAKAWDGEQVVWPDGDLTYTIVKFRNYWHVCRSGSSGAVAVDAARQDAVLRSLSCGRNSAVATLAASALESIGGCKNTQTVCVDAVRCRIRCDTVFLNLAKVSVSPFQAAVLILNHGAARAKLWFYFETAMLESDDGELTAFPGRYFIDREQDYLHIIPTGDSGTHVVYRWSVIHAYVTKQCIVLPGGHRFFSEVIDRTPGILYMDLTDASGDCDLSPRLERRLDTGVRKQVDISFSVFLPKAWGSSNSAERVKLRVAADVWDKVRSRLMAMKEERMTPLAAREAVSDFTQQRIDVTAFIRLPLPKKYDEPELLAMAAHRYVALERVLMNLEKTLTTTYVQGQWELSSRNLAMLMVRAMWDTGASIAGAVLSLPGFIRTYGARMHNALFSDYIVEVTPAVEELMFVESVEEAEQVGTRVATAVGYPGYSSEELRSVSARSEEFEDVRARALAVTRELAEAEAMVAAWADSGVYTGEAYHSVEREVKKDGHRDLGKDREEVVQKLSTVVPDGMARHVSRVEDRPVCPSRQEMPDDDAEELDPIGVLQEGFSRILPLTTSIDIEKRPYVLSEADRIQNLDTMRFVTNRAKDVGPEEKLVLRPGIHTDVGGKRPVTQALTVSAVAKRVGGAPVYADPIIFEERLREDFRKFEEFALKPGWRERTRAAVDGGLWDLDEHTIRSYAAKLSTSNVGKIIAEDFHAGNIDLTKWEIMVKSSLKPRMEESTFYTDPAAQTIIYQKSKVTNSWFSMKLGKFHDFLDQELNDNIRINARRDEEDDEDWQTAVMQFYEPGDVNVECDITQCDKSQARYNLALYFYIIKQFGAPEWLMELWEVVIGKKTATATTVGLMVEFLNQILSGFWGTISANSLIVFLANVVCLGLTRENTRSVECKGDDTTVIMKKMIYTPVEVSERFNSMFNFEAKVETKEDIYNCSKHTVVVEGRAYRPKDPEKVISTLGRSLPWSANVEEQWESFRDSTRYYGNKLIMDALDEAYMRRTGRESLRGQMRAIGQLRRSFDAFKELKVHHTQWLS